MKNIPLVRTGEQRVGAAFSGESLKYGTLDCRLGGLSTPCDTKGWGGGVGES
jgi:hypothetical protein